MSKKIRKRSKEELGGKGMKEEEERPLFGTKKNKSRSFHLTGTGGEEGVVERKARREERLRRMQVFFS